MNIVRTSLLLSFAVILFSCSSTNRLKYFQNLSDTAQVQRLLTYPYQPLKLQIDDQLEIIVSSNSPEAAQYFNRGAAVAVGTTAGNVSVGGASGAINIYAIGSNGTITMPVLGEVYVLKLTTEQLKQKITFLLKDYLKNAVVSVRLVNLKVTVIGEVGNTSIIPVLGEKLNIIEALSSSGDLTVNSQRYGLKVMRQKGDTLEVGNLDMYTTDVFKSPYFQLHQNDIVYVTPLKRKDRSAQVISPIVSLGIGAVGVIFGLIALFR